MIQKKHSFEGIIPNLDRRYLETESNAVREELGKFLNSQTCPDCHGTRLNESARNVFVGDQNLPQISEMSVCTHAHTRTRTHARTHARALALMSETSMFACKT